MKTNISLHNNKYSMEQLINNIYYFNLLDIVKTQVLTKEFIINYILNKDFQLLENEKNILIEDILKYQPHLNQKDLIFKKDLKKEYFNFENYI